MMGRSPLRSLSLNNPGNHLPRSLRSRVETAEEASIEQPSKNTGRWHKWEKLAFLRGLRMHGRGRWKRIAKMIPTRDTIQVKTHAQVMLKKLDEGQDIFEELDLDNAAAYPYYEMYGFYTAPRDSATRRVASEEPSFMGGSEMFKNVSDELTVAESLLQLAGTSETNPWAASSASIYIL